MKHLFKSPLFYTWYISAVLSLTALLGRNPHYFPWLFPPESVTLWMIEWYGAKNSEDIADLELLYVFCFSLLFVLIISILSIRLKRWLMGQ